MYTNRSEVPYVLDSLHETNYKFLTKNDLKDILSLFWINILPSQISFDPLKNRLKVRGFVSGNYGTY